MVEGGPGLRGDDDVDQSGGVFDGQEADSVGRGWALPAGDQSHDMDGVPVPQGVELVGIGDSGRCEVLPHRKHGVGGGVLASPNFGEGLFREGEQGQGRGVDAGEVLKSGSGDGADGPEGFAARCSDAQGQLEPIKVGQSARWPAPREQADGRGIWPALQLNTHDGLLAFEFGCRELLDAGLGGVPRCFECGEVFGRDEVGYSEFSMIESGDSRPPCRSSPTTA